LKGAGQTAFLLETVKFIQSIEPDNICVTIIMENHVHLRDARYLVIDLNAEEAIFGEVVPVPKCLFLVIFIECFASVADIVHCV
jgi:hypothetical protein